LSGAKFYVPVPDDIDLEYLSRFLPVCLFFLRNPLSDAVLLLYRFVVLQTVDLDGALRDLEESRAEVERKDIELDQALQDRRPSVSSLETRVKSLQEERKTLGKSVATLLGGYWCRHISVIYFTLRLDL
jgi:nucleoprotein TPR